MATVRFASRTVAIALPSEISSRALTSEASCPGQKRCGYVIFGKSQRNFSPIVYILVIFFGSSSWINVCSVWMELPLMVYKLPELWSLPSYLAVIVQVAVIAPLLFGLYKRFGKRKFEEAPLIAALIAFEAVCMALLAFLWQETASVAGADHSVALFGIFFLLSAVDCSSNVIFLPYMARFKPAYTTAYFIGMGVSALTPTVVGLIQGAGQVICVASDNSTNATKYPQSIPPRFGVDIYNLIICGWMLLTLASFCLLHWSKIGKRERAVVSKIGSHNSEVPLVENQEKLLMPSPGEVPVRKFSSLKGFTHKLDEQFVKHEVSQFSMEWNPNVELSSACDCALSAQSHALDSSTFGFHSIENSDISCFTNCSSNLCVIPKYFLLLLLTGWACALMNGVLPSIQTYAAMPYGQEAFHLSIALPRIANTIGCFVPFFVNVKSSWLISVLTVITTGISGYILHLAVLSPDALLADTNIGAALCVAAWTLSMGFLAYIRTVIAGILREAEGNSEKRLFWCGVFTQLGSFIGALVMFPLVSIYELFQMAPMCA